MNKKEQDMIRKLKEKTDDIMIPEDVKPDRVMELLEEKYGKKKKRNLYRIGGLVAACLVIAAGIGVYRAGGSAGTGGKSELPGREIPEIGSEIQVASAEDYEEVYACIQQFKKEMEEEAKAYEEGLEYVEDTAGAMSENQKMSSDMAVASDKDSGGGYSETNVRQEGVDEGDVVKTDGTYLYILKNNREEVSIVDTRGGSMKKAGDIKAEDAGIQEIYLDTERKRLILVISRYGDGDGFAKKAYVPTGKTEAVTYDISDPEHPKESGKVTQSGFYDSSRMAGGYLYLFSSYGIDWEYMERSTPETYIPLVNDTLVSGKDICLPSEKKGNQYTIAASVNLDRPDRVADSKAILSRGGQLYVSNETIYYYETIWEPGLTSGRDMTVIRSIAYKDGILTPGAQGSIKGYINDSFSIDEYKGFLRVVTTNGETNSVYVLDKKFKAVGSIENLAKGERVYSARLMGDIGYFVTFRETDPLFSVDLSNPKKPKIIGSLKIPGFSDYLHPYGKGKLLGIGMNVDEDTQITDGVKLTMFDISDPGDVKEEDTYVLKNVYSTDVSYDYKAALVDRDKNIIGFTGDTDGGQHYYIFGYDPSGGFVCRMDEEINGNSNAIRGVYIGETLYVVQGNIIEAYSLKDYKKVDDLIL